MTKYALESLQTCPPAILKQIRPDQLRKNNTNQPMRWKEIAFSDDLEKLKQYLTPSRRIINWDTLEVMCVGKNEAALNDQKK